MQRKQNVFILVLTVTVVLILTLLVGTTIRFVNQNITQACFDNLVTASRMLARDLYKTVDMDRTILTAMATVIENGDEYEDAELCTLMQAYTRSVSYLSYVELLRPDNTLLEMNGTVRNVAGAFDFAAEAAKGAYISGVEQSTLDPAEKVVRNAVPVKRNGETAYMLYGVVRLSEMPEKFRTDIYDGHAYVYVEDGDTGDFMLDTRHKTLGNISDFEKRQTLPGYSLEQARADMQRGVGGDVAFVSQTTGDILYMHYEPIGVNNWNVAVTVEKQYALRESGIISASLYRMAGMIGAAMLLYMACVAFCLLRAYRQVQKMGTQDQNTGLQNRNAYDKYVVEQQKKTFASIVCVYADANGLHEINNKYGHAVGDQMLKTVADALKKNFDHDSIYRIGGDEFIVFCEEGDPGACGEKMREANAAITAQGYSISYGIVCYKNETGVDRIIHDADERMLKNKRDYYMAHDRRQR